jgi:hypothetical protein
MKKMIIAVAVLLLSSWLTARAGESAPLKAHPDTKGWTDLFAADLSNAQAPAGVWSWKDGELTPKDKDEVIWSKKEYENFILDLEFNLEPAANSGVLVYCSDLQNWIPNTIEIQLLDDAAPKWANIPPQLEVWWRFWSFDSSKGSSKESRGVEPHDHSVPRAEDFRAAQWRGGHRHQHEGLEIG